MFKSREKGKKRGVGWIYTLMHYITLNKITFLILPSNYQAASSDHKTTVEPSCYYNLASRILNEQWYPLKAKQTTGL